MFNLEDPLQAFLTIPTHQASAHSLAKTLETIHGLCNAIRQYEEQGYSQADISEWLNPLRAIHRRSEFIRRTQDWPKGYPGDYETTEYILEGINKTEPGTLEYWFEECVLQAAIAQQHRNKLSYQGRLIVNKLSHKPDQPKKILCLASSCGWELRQIQHLITDVPATLFLNDHDSDALAFAYTRLSKVQNKCQLVQGNFIRALKMLAEEGPFDLITTGGLCDYLSNRQVAYLIENAYELLAPGGQLYLTNVAIGNPYRPWMEYLGNWHLIERSEADIYRLAEEVGCKASSIDIQREASGLTLLIKIRK